MTELQEKYAEKLLALSYEAAGDGQNSIAAVLCALTAAVTMDEEELFAKGVAKVVNGTLDPRLKMRLELLRK